MNRGLLLASVFFVILLRAGAPVTVFAAQNEPSPSVLVTLTKLQKGSLPRIVTVFGKVEASTSMRHTITAPATAMVDAIFVKSGEKVKPGAPLVRLGPTTQTAAAYKKAVSALNDARGLVQRTQSLLEQHLATRQQLADAEKAVSDSQASFNALSAEGASTPQTLSAPDDAIVTAVATSLGTFVNQGAVLMELAGSEGLVLHAGAVPEHAAESHQGDRAKVTPLGRAEVATGNVVLRGSIVDPNTGLVPIDIALPTGSFLSGSDGASRRDCRHSRWLCNSASSRPDKRQRRSLRRTGQRHDRPRRPCDDLAQRWSEGCGIRLRWTPQLISFLMVITS